MTKNKGWQFNFYFSVMEIYNMVLALKEHTVFLVKKNTDIKNCLNSFLNLLNKQILDVSEEGYQHLSLNPEYHWSM